MALNSYSTGTVTIAANGTSVTGAGTIWSGVNVRPGDILQVGDFQTVITDVTDTATLVIPPWGGGAQAGASYVVWQVSPQRFAGAQAMADVSTLVAGLNTDGFYVFVGPTLTVPDPSYGNDGQYAFQASTGKLWIKTGGAWSFIGVYKGFGIPAPYDNAHTYSINDVATSSGSSYVWINSTPGSGHAPPNATYWAVLASKGDAATVTVGTTTTGAGGSSASVANSGTSSAAVFDFTIPAGKTYGGTSTTSLAIGTGSKAFTTQAGLAYTNGARVRASSAANTSNWMEGLVTYSGTTLTMTVDKTNGSGTLADWNLNIVGQPSAGDLTSTNNLSDVSSAITAHDNLIKRGADIASAATLNLDTATGEIVNVTGTTNITAMTLTDGHRRLTRFLGILTITAGASIVLPYGLATYTTAVGDIIEWASYGSTATAIAFYPATQAAQRNAIGLNGTFVQVSGLGPTGTSSSAGAHMGVGAACQLVAPTTGRIEFEFYGQMTSTNIASGTVQMRYGAVPSVSPPSNGATTLVGTSVGSPAVGTVGGAGYNVPFKNGAIISGLTQGTTYWFDLVVSTGSGLVITLPNLQFKAKGF
ncbi:hypothetical protein [Bradyrhizobium sp. LB11.1]|uniref:hypothetical protein n=1 Tax=Bradyrhizobium sp. LB11.1 TaxID=3156326 RepID=UPI00339258F3